MTLTAEEPERHAGAAGAKVVALVVEDEVLLRLALADDLRDEGYVVMEAGTADEALDLLRTVAGRSVDIMITDIRMPGSMDGLDLAKLTRRERPDMKIVVLSSHLPPAEQGDDLDAWFSKPYELPPLLTRLKELLGREP